MKTVTIDAPTVHKRHLGGYLPLLALEVGYVIAGLRGGAIVDEFKVRKAVRRELDDRFGAGGGGGGGPSLTGAKVRVHFSETSASANGSAGMQTAKCEVGKSIVSNVGMNVLSMRTAGL